MAGKMIEDLKERWIGREKEIDILCKILWTSYGPPVLVYGRKCTGKTKVIKDVLKSLNSVKWIYVNAKACHTHKILFDEILSEAIDIYNIPNMIPPIINDIMSFTTYLDQILVKHGIGRIILVIDNADNIEGLYTGLTCNFLTCLSKYVRCVFISECSLERYTRTNGGAVTVHFDIYSTDTLNQIFQRNIPLHVNASIYKSYITQIISTFQGKLNNFHELRYLLQFLWPTYIGEYNITNKETPLSEEEKQDPGFLFRRISPYLRVIEKHLYRHDYTIENLHKDVIGETRGEERSAMLAFKHENLELPRVMKYVIFAAYLCSYNPADTDTRYFSQFGETSRKRKGRTASKRSFNEKASISRHLLGPHPFPLERLYKVFEYIYVSENDAGQVNGLKRVYDTNDIPKHVMTLIELHFIERVSVSHDLLDVRLKCHLSFDIIKKLAISCNFPIQNFLYEVPDV